MQIIIEVDWDEENSRLKESATTLDELVALAVKKKLSSAQLARMHIVQRELGLVEDDDVLADNKTLLQNGGTQGIYYAFRRLKKEIEVNGKTYRARELVGSVADDESQPARVYHTAGAPLGSTASYIPGENHDEGAILESTASTEQEPAATWHVLGTPGALEEAVKYLDRHLPGQIVGRCLIIKASGGDVEEALAKLFDKIVKIAADFA